MGGGRSRRRPSKIWGGGEFFCPPQTEITDRQNEGGRRPGAGAPSEKEEQRSMNVSSSSLRRGRQSSTAALTIAHSAAAAAAITGAGGGIGGGSGRGIGNVVRQSLRRRIVRGSGVLDDEEDQKRRRKRRLESSAHAHNLTDGCIFDGVVACLSGQARDVKDRIHAIIGGGVDSDNRIDDNGIKRGGGRGGMTMGNFDPRYVTHLVLDAPTGSKFDHWRRNYRLHRLHEAAAASTSSSRPSPYEWADRLHVVRTSWVEACSREGRRVPEDDYRLPSPSEDEDDEMVRRDDDAEHSRATSTGGRGSGTLADKKGASEGRVNAVVVASSISSSMAQKVAANEATMSSPSSKSRPSSDGRRPRFSLPEEILRLAPTLVERCDHVMQYQQQQQQRRRHGRFTDAVASAAHVDGNVTLFAGQSFLLVGFDDDRDDESSRDDDNFGGCRNEIDNTNTNEINDDVIGDDDPRGRRRALKCKVAQLIRKSGGTIYYEPNEWITMVVLSLGDDCYREEDENDNSYLRIKMMW